MVTVKCPSQPSLWIPHLGVQFVDGVAEVSDETAVALAAYRAHGVVLPGDKEAADAPVDEAVKVEKPATPAKKATRRTASKPFG